MSLQDPETTISGNDPSQVGTILHGILLCLRLLSCFFYFIKRGMGFAHGEDDLGD
jgi:hypothetical protein